MERKLMSTIKEITALVDNRERGILRAANSELILFFWKIGRKLLEAEVGTHQNLVASGLSLESIVTELNKTYGPLFSRRNLKNMKLFATRVPDESFVKMISAMLSWEHIVSLLQLRDFESQCFYVRLSVEDGLSPMQLNNAINKKLHKHSYDSYKPPSREGFNSWYTTTLLNQKSEQKLKYNNIFDDNEKINIERLLAASIPKRIEYLNKDYQIQTLKEEINVFIKLKNEWLNGVLNMSFYEIGKVVYHHANSLDLSDDKSTWITELSGSLTAKYGNNFSENQLLLMSRFGSSVPDPVAARIAFLVTWNHIPILLQASDHSDMLAYANLVASSGLKVDALNEIMANNLYNNVTSLGVSEDEASTPLRIRINTTQVTSSRNAVVNIRTEYIDDDIHPYESGAVESIFKNRYFPLVQVPR